MYVWLVPPAAVALTPQNDNGRVDLQPEPIEEMNRRGGPRCRRATALQEVQAANRQLEGEDHGTENETANPARFPTDKLKEAREQLEAIYASENEDTPKMVEKQPTATNVVVDGANTVETKKKDTIETEKQDIDKIMGNGKNTTGKTTTGKNTTGKTVVSQTIHWIEDESTEWLLSVPLWVEMLLRVIGMFVGAMIVYYLHNARYRAVHGCATVFCIFYCCPCGCLALCCPIDEATPEFNDEPEEDEIPVASQPSKDAEELNEQIETKAAESVAGVHAPPQEGQMGLN